MTNADLVYQNGPWNPTPRDILARRAFIKRTRDGTPNIGNTIIRIPIHSYNTPIIGRLPPSAYATASITHKSLAYGTKKKPQAGRRSLQRLKSKARPEDQPQDDRDDFIERYNREINANVDTLMTDANPTKSLFKSGKKFDVEAVDYISDGSGKLLDPKEARYSIVSNNSNESNTQAMDVENTDNLVALADKEQEEREDVSSGSDVIGVGKSEKKESAFGSTFRQLGNLLGTTAKKDEVDTHDLSATASTAPIVLKTRAEKYREAKAESLRIKEESDRMFNSNGTTAYINSQLAILKKQFDRQIRIMNENS